MYGPGQTNDYQQRKKDLIDKNYLSVYKNLLSDDRKYNHKTGKYMVPCKKPFYIGNKDVYALSDIEGQNLTFLKMLEDLGLVNIFYDNNKNAPKGAHECLTKINGELGYKKVYYTFNENACGIFQDVIVLCGDYIAHTDYVDDIECAKDTVKILKKLNDLLNGNKQVEDKNKRLFLIAGNHDINSQYEGENNNGVRNLKEEVLQLGLYPQLLLVNSDGKRLLFQHTNFPYREKNNYIVNKKIDPKKAEKLLESDLDSVKKLPIFDNNGFFHLRYIAKQGNLTPKYYGIQDMSYTYPLLRELYSDLGMGYDAKFIGHDSTFNGSVKRKKGGSVYNVHTCNHNKQHYFKFFCAKKYFGFFHEAFMKCYNNLGRENLISKKIKSQDELYNLAIRGACKALRNHLLNK